MRKKQFFRFWFEKYLFYSDTKKQCDFTSQPELYWCNEIGIKAALKMTVKLTTVFLS